MAKIYEIEVIGEEKEIKETKKKFNAYNTYDKNNKKVTVKFTKDCENVPPVGRHIIKISTEHANMDLTGRFPTLWVNKVEEFRVPEKKDTMEAYFN